MGATPLHMAAVVLPDSEAQTILLLLRYGASVNTDSFYGSALALAMAKPKIAMALIESGADVNQQIRNSKTNEIEHILFDAVRRGHVDVLELLIKRGANIETTNSSGATPFGYAVEVGLLDKAEKLASLGANVNAVNHNGESPLMGAAVFKNLSALQLLLRLGASMELGNPDGNAIIYAVLGNSLEVVEELVKAGANLKAPSPKGYTPLVYAILKGNDAIAQFLWRQLGEKGEFNTWEYLAELEIQPQSSLLHIAAVLNNAPVIKYLVETRKLDVNGRSTGDDKTPAIKAAEYGSVGALRELKRLGADFTIASDHGVTPLHEAVYCQQLEAMNVLVKELGVDIHICTPNFGNTSVHVASYFERLHALQALIQLGADVNYPASFEHGDTPLFNIKSLPVFNILHQAGADVNYQNKIGRRPLFVYCEEERVDLVDRALQVGADVNAKDDQGFTPLFLAVKHPQIFKKLLDAGADTSTVAEATKTSILHMAAEFGHPQVLEELLARKKWDIHVREQQGLTPLHVAAFAGNVDCFKILVEKGANIKAVGDLGESVLHLAVQYVFYGEASGKQSSECVETTKKIVQILIDNGADLEAVANDGMTPLLYSHFLNIPFLLEMGANVNNGVPSDGKHLIHLLVESRSVDLLKMTIEKGVNVNVKDGKGRMPLELAQELGFSDVVDVLPGLCILI